MVNINQEFKVNLSDIFSNFLNKNLLFYEILEENLRKVYFTKELLNLRADNLVISGFDENDFYRKYLDLYAASSQPYRILYTFFYCTTLI